MNPDTQGTTNKISF